MDKLGMGRLNGKRRRDEEDEGWAGFRDRGRKKAETGLTPTGLTSGKKPTQCKCRQALSAPDGSCQPGRAGKVLASC